MAKPQLWAKDLPLDQVVHAFTVGRDPELDLQLLPFDAWGSAAHARTLHRAGLLELEDARALVAELKQLQAQARAGGLVIQLEQEDGHTLLEAELTTRLGAPGQRIHAGRSRNDQVATALRLWMREQLLAVEAESLALANALFAFAEAHPGALPGYTHLRRAMPSSWAQWASAHAEALLEEVEAVESLWHRLDRCPLGSGAGYGVPLPLDREFTARLLGFTRLHRNAAEVQLSRGRTEAAFLHALGSLGLALERFCQDALLFSTEEFGFLRLPVGFTTGSSLMPQKRNPDVLELARAKARELRGQAARLDALASGLSGGYHRDFQLLKAPLMEGCAGALELLRVLTHVVPGLEPLSLAEAVSAVPELHATQSACDRALAGQPFREAYGAVAKEIAEGTFAKPLAGPAAQSPGSPGALDLEGLRRDLQARAVWIRSRRIHLESAELETWNLDTMGDAHD
ncbi:MAG: argininosuccinate lyase [Acidobacteria bacterium]|nr:argininosuccinate lyase [Acidobacteriota bacterium]